MTQAMAHALVGWVRPQAVTHQPAARLARAMPLASMVGNAAKRLTHPTQARQQRAGSAGFVLFAKLSRCHPRPALETAVEGARFGEAQVAGDVLNR